MTDTKCEECEGTGYVDYQIAVDDFKKMYCEKCNIDGGYNEDDAYDAWKDSHLEEPTELKEIKND